MAPGPLSPLPPTIQNTKQRNSLSPVRNKHPQNPASGVQEENSITKSFVNNNNMGSHSHHEISEEDDEFHDSFSNTTSPAKHSLHSYSANGSPESVIHRSPRKVFRDEIDQHDPSSTHDSIQNPTLRFNEGLTRAIGQMQDQSKRDDSTMLGADEGMSTIVHGRSDKNGIGAGDETEITLSLDDTMGDISTFSAIPDTDLTRFAALRNAAESPSKRNGPQDWSPSKQLRAAAATPSTVKRPLQLLGRSLSGGSPDGDVTPRRPLSTSEDLLNFTGQSNVFIPPQSQNRPRPGLGRSPSGRGAFPIRVNPSPSHRSQASVDRERSRGGPSPVKATATPSQPERRTNLLDFDLDPIPTPRSIPTVTPRELESLRSELSSQILSLSATLSGKEAEVQALKRAITDAEVRVGNTSEELRNEKSLRENLEHDQSEWERQRREMETVLREIRQEIMIGEHERDKLRRQAEDAEKKTEDMEVRVVELQTRLDSAHRRVSLSPNSSPKKDSSVEEPATPLMNGTASDGMDINEAVREATERVARDLHALYKSKHETKVAALKKSYEARWEKKVRHLEEELKSATTEIVNLKTERDATMSGPVHVISAEAQAAAEKEKQQLKQLLDNQTRISEQLGRENETIKTENKTLGAKVEGLQTEIASIHTQSEDLREQLERERIEKGDLVAQVDLFLALGDDQQQQQQPHNHPVIPSSTSSPGKFSTGTTESRTRSVSSDSIITSAPSTTSTSSISYSTSNSSATPSNPPSITTSPGRLNNAGSRTGAGRPRPMSMLQPPGKYFSAIPGPGGVKAGGAKGLPVRSGIGGGGVGGGGIMDGIAKMGAGARGGGGGY